MSPDPFRLAYDRIGEDFAAYMPLNAYVTVTQIDPDTETNTTRDGVVLATATGVNALKRSRRRQPFGVGGGELGQDQCRFVFAVAAVTWVLKARDQITEEDGTVWNVEKVELTAFNQLAACDVVRKR